MQATKLMAVAVPVVRTHRMAGVINRVYAPTVMYHEPNMRELYRQAAVLQQRPKLIGTLPDCCFVPQHICATCAKRTARRSRWAG